MAIFVFIATCGTHVSVLVFCVVVVQGDDVLCVVLLLDKGVVFHCNYINDVYIYDTNVTIYTYIY